MKVSSQVLMLSAVASLAIAVHLQADEVHTGTITGVEKAQFHHFRLACLNCQNGDRGVAGRHIRQGAEFLRRQAGQATAKGKQALQRSIDELDRLADAVERGTESSIDEVKSAFARAHHALAYHHQEKASESWLRRRVKDTGEHLQAAANQIEYGVSWAGEGVEHKSNDVLAATRDLAKGMIRGAQVDAKHVKTRTESLARQVRSFGRKVLQPVRR